MATTSAPRHQPAAPPVRPRAAADGLCLRIPASARTLAGFRAWVKSDDFPDNIRVAYLEGEIYLDMSKEELETHNSVKFEVARSIGNLNRELDRGKYYTDGALVSNEAAEVSNNPDGTFITWESLDAGRVRLIPREGRAGQYMEIEGTPDWILEVISNSSVVKDTQVLRRNYHRAGIGEYWLVDARGPEIRFQILYWRKSGYVAAPNRDGWQRSRVFGRSFRLVRTRDRGGLWQYTLEVQTG